MPVFWALVLAYILAEFTLRGQLGGLAPQSKKERALRVLLFAALAIILTFPHLRERWFELGGFSLTGYGGVWVAAFFYGAAGFVFDAREVRKIVFPSSLVFLAKLFFQFLLFFLLDSGEHLYSHGHMLPDFWLLFVILLTALWRPAELFLFYFEKDICRFSKSYCAYPAADLSFLSALFRSGMMCICLLPGYLKFAFVLAWLWCARYAQKERILDVSNINLLGGLGLAFAAGIFLRWVSGAGY